MRKLEIIINKEKIVTYNILLFLELEIFNIDKNKAIPIKVSIISSKYYSKFPYPFKPSINSLLYFGPILQVLLSLKVIVPETGSTSLI